MHVRFFAYGDRHAVERLLNSMESQAFKLPFKIDDPNATPLLSSDGEACHGFVWSHGSIRYLPGGAIDYIFPKNALDAVLNTLEFNKETHYDYYGWKFKTFVKMWAKLLGSVKAPDYKKDIKYIWSLENINIIPLGVKYDEMDFADRNGTTHEAL